ncbi:TetR/AcrR family transcriptional regulator [Nocardia yamanashiensis]|uniref:TetR/AcrR family transcriptional regulator n=1 Tax=Nocardia yamanashiensis TaxID=209247 RepID=UPI00082CCD39|nr:TetR/AcrR family transcriptional regulator [Nocardia yamanashiensis]
MARLSRQQTQARTREELLTVATRHFLEHGYAAASLEQIAEEAGYSKGAVYSNFANKDGLCLEVLNQIRLSKVGEVVAAIADAESVDAILELFREWAERTIGDRNWTLLEIEFSTRSRHSESVRTDIADGASQVRAALAAALQLISDRFELAPAMPAEAAALILLSSGVGLGLQRAVDPGVSVEPLIDLLRIATGSAT